MLRCLMKGEGVIERLRGIDRVTSDSGQSDADLATDLMDPTRTSGT